MARGTTPAMPQRINLRLSDEVYEPYVILAQLLTGMGRPITATQLVREVVEGHVEQAEIVIAYARAALRGDEAAQRAVFEAMLAWHQAAIDVARAVEDAEGRHRVMGLSDEP